MKDCELLEAVELDLACFYGAGFESDAPPRTAMAKFRWSGAQVLMQSFVDLKYHGD